MDTSNSDKKCKNRFRIRRFIAKAGWRYALLFDSAEGAMPAYWPTAFCSHSLAHMSAATELKHLETIKKIEEWAASQSVVIVDLLRSGKGFTAQQLDSLTESLNRKRRLSKDDEKGATVNARTYNSSLDEASRYFSWLFTHLRSTSNSLADVTFLSELKKALKIRKRKKGSRAAYTQALLNKKISEPTRKALFEKFDNPLKSSNTDFQKGISFRDTLMLRIFYDLGIRLGELLSLKLEDFIPARGGDHAYINIVRNQDDAFDRRVNQPVAKTNGRMLAISPELESEILKYLGDWRAFIPNVSFEDNAFIFVVHKAGINQGQALEISSIRSYFTTLRLSDKRLCGLHPHLLRHDWNYRFSKECKERKTPEKEEIEQRCFLMGWVPNSSMAKHYNRRHTAEEAYTASVSMAYSITRPKRD
ncbi:integrase [Aeromonas caviae]|nr:integrase [Aeromonas caviae]